MPPEFPRGVEGVKDFSEAMRALIEQEGITPDEVEELKAAMLRLGDTAGLPAEEVAARATGGRTPLGVHVCMSGRAKGASWVYDNEYWNCPFCGDHGSLYPPPPMTGFDGLGAP